MMQVAITDTRRRWTWFRRRRFVLTVPEGWSDIAMPDRPRWWLAALEDAAAAQRALFAHLVPRRVRQRLSAEDAGAIAARLAWLEAKSDCTTVPLSTVTVRGVEYHLPRPDGANVTCGEFAVCDDLYRAVVATSDREALERLACTLYRPANPDTAAARRAGDVRVPFFHTDESDARRTAMGTVPEVLCSQALLYFSGLKQWVHTVYGSYIFEQQDDDEGNEQDPDGVPTKESQPAQSGPNFGWWGMLQAVAEGRVFGNLNEVYQASLHEVCIYLVRKREEADRLRQSQPTTTTNSYDDDLR